MHKPVQSTLQKYHQLRGSKCRNHLPPNPNSWGFLVCIELLKYPVYPRSPVARESAQVEGHRSSQRYSSGIFRIGRYPEDVAGHPSICWACSHWCPQKQKVPEKEQTVSVNHIKVSSCREKPFQESVDEMAPITFITGQWEHQRIPAVLIHCDTLSSAVWKEQSFKASHEVLRTVCVSFEQGRPATVVAKWQAELPAWCSSIQTGWYRSLSTHLVLQLQCDVFPSFHCHGDEPGGRELPILRLSPVFKFLDSFEKSCREWENGILHVSEQPGKLSCWFSFVFPKC